MFNTIYLDLSVQVRMYVLKLQFMRKIKRNNDSKFQLKRYSIIALCAFNGWLGMNGVFSFEQHLETNTDGMSRSRVHRRAVNRRRRLNLGIVCAKRARSVFKKINGWWGERKTNKRSQQTEATKHRQSVMRRRSSKTARTKFHCATPWGNSICEDGELD